jgi:predicted TIM-barrel fold metal-dependent hydrolase
VTRFIDLHVHPPVPEMLDGAFGPYIDAMRSYFGRDHPVMLEDEIAEHYRERDGRAVLLAWDAQTATAQPPLTNQFVARMVEANPDVFLGFGSVDPLRGAAAVAGVHEAARLGLKGLKFHPPAQRFSPSDRRVYPVWDVAQSLGLPILVHTGFTALGAGMPGGGGIELGFGDPMALDRVAVDFPELTIVLAHPSWPWVEQGIAVARHKENVWLELSGWSPKLFPDSLREAIRGPLADRTVFGTDFPFLTPDKWLGDFDTLGFPDDVAEKIVFSNAERLLGLE